MSLSILHSFVSAKSDSADATLVRPTNWNAEHSIALTGPALIGRSTANNGAATEISLANSLFLSSDVLGTRLGLAIVNKNSSDQAVATGAITKVTFTNEVVDQNGWFDNATNFRYQPTLSGYYRVRSQLYITSSAESAGAIGFPSIYKTGALLVYGNFFFGVAATLAIAGVDAIVSLNGSSEYVEIFVDTSVISAAASKVVGGLPEATRAEFFRVGDL